MTDFKTIKQGSFLVLFSIVFFSLIGLVFIGAATMGLIKGENYPFELLFIFGFLFLGVAFLIFLQSYAWYTAYGIDKDSIIIRGIYKKGKISKEDIQEARILSQDDTQEYVTEYYKAIAKEEVILSAKDWYHSLGKYSQLLKYSTVAFSQATAKLAEYGLKNEVLYETRTYVLILLKNKSSYVLSPVDSKGFVAALNL